MKTANQMISSLCEARSTRAKSLRIVDLKEGEVTIIDSEDAFDITGMKYIVAEAYEVEDEEEASSAVKSFLSKAKNPHAIVGSAEDMAVIVDGKPKAMKVVEDADLTVYKSARALIVVPKFS